MRSRGQTSLEYILLVAGVILLALVVGYYVFQSVYSTHQDIESVNTNIFD